MCKEPRVGKAGGITRAGMQAVGGAIPFAGGILSAVAGMWGESEQLKWNEFFKHWAEMLEDELREKQQTIIEIFSHLDVHDKEIADRIKGYKFQSLLKKAFREWAGTVAANR
jgi:hypothetical protein